MSEHIPATDGDEPREPTLCQACGMDHPNFTACPPCEDDTDAMILPCVWR